MCPCKLNLSSGSCGFILNLLNEVFTTGTMGELTKVNEIDGRIIENKNNSDITQRIISEFSEITETEGEPLNF